MIVFSFFSIEKFTFVAVFIIQDDEYYDTLAALKIRVAEKLTLIPNHTKLVMAGRYGWKSMAEVPESLYVTCRAGVVSILAPMIEIFNKRWQTLDLISMIRESKRAINKNVGWYRRSRYRTIEVDNLSTLPTFQKKEEEHSS